VEAAMTGHLVFTTLHTNNAAQTIDRIIDMFPAEQQAQGSRYRPGGPTPGRTERTRERDRHKDDDLDDEPALAPAPKIGKPPTVHALGRRAARLALAHMVHTGAGARDHDLTFDRAGAIGTHDAVAVVDLDCSGSMPFVPALAACVYGHSQSTSSGRRLRAQALVPPRTEAVSTNPLLSRKSVAARLRLPDSHMTRIRLSRGSPATCAGN